MYTPFFTEQMLHFNLEDAKSVNKAVYLKEEETINCECRYM